MNSTQPRQYFASNHRDVAYGATFASAAREAIEWEELPSLAGSPAHRPVARGALSRASVGARAGLETGFETGPASTAPWNTTLAATLDALPPSPPSQPFREALSGLSMREVNEPDVFRHFFGSFTSGR